MQESSLSPTGAPQFIRPARSGRGQRNRRTCRQSSTSGRPIIQGMDIDWLGIGEVSTSRKADCAGAGQCVIGCQDPRNVLAWSFRTD